LKKLAAGDKNIIFTGRVDDIVLREYLQKCRALIFCAEEDFGLAPLEAQACGSPVIAFGRGGACETVIDGKTGIFFKEQTSDSLKNAIERFEELESKNTFDSKTISEHAQTFSEKRFCIEFKNAVDETIKYCNYGH
jgi:glycosyltransferase involved in cell wall biosynthesis